jgi:GNAT superfamily N-acetyltransferase
VLDFQIRHATQRDFVTIIRFIQDMLSEMETLSSRALTDQAEAWLDFESRILQALSCDKNVDHTYSGAADQLLEIAETIGGEVLPIGLIEASVLRPASMFRLVPTLYIHALYVLPLCRCQGVGTALLHAALAWGCHHHCLRAQLTVLPHNPARRLYRELGFTTDGLELRQELVPVS